MYHPTIYHGISPFMASILYVSWHILILRHLIIFLASSIDQSTFLNYPIFMRMCVHLKTLLSQVVSSQGSIYQHLHPSTIMRGSSKVDQQVGNSHRCSWSNYLLVSTAIYHPIISMSLACIYSGSRRCITRIHACSRLRMNRLKCWSAHE